VQLSSLVKDSQRALHRNIPFFEKIQLLNNSNLEFNDSPQKVKYSILLPVDCAKSVLTDLIQNTEQ
jgi:hypothetical protein